MKHCKFVIDDLELHYPIVNTFNTSDTGEEFLALSVEKVISLVQSDNLSVPSEEKVFECIIAWVNHDLPGRQDQIGQLLQYVRLPLLDQEYLVSNVEESALVKSNSFCKDILIEAMKYHLLK